MRQRNIDMTPEWIAVGISILVAIASAVQIWQNTNIKLAVSKTELTLEKRFGEIQEWSRNTFVSKHDQMRLLELVGRDEQTRKAR
jgi:hypothetical protein